MAGAIGYLFWNLKNMNTRITHLMDENEIRQLIQDKMEVFETRQRTLEKRLDRVDNKLDLILDKLSGR